LIKDLYLRLKSFVLFSLITLIIWVPLLILWAPWHKFYSEQGNRTFCKYITKGFIFACKLFGLNYRVEGKENLKEALNRKGCIWASKHQSTWETFYLQTITSNLAIILKDSLLKVPFFGNCVAKSMTLGIRRDQGISAIRDILKFSRKYLDQGRQVLIFPEGKRTTYGEKIDSYQIGIAAMYEKLNAPVLPIALNSGRFWGRHTSSVSRGTITVRFLPIIEPGLDRKEFMKRLARDIENACADIDNIGFK